MQIYSFKPSRIITVLIYVLDFGNLWSLNLGLEK